MKGSSAKKTMGNTAPTSGPSPNLPSLLNNTQSKVLQVYWEHVPACTNCLLDYLLKHPADCFNDETELMIASLALGKMAWYQAKIDYAMQDRELDFRREMRDIEHADVEVAHICNQEAKKLDIELLEKEVETLRLKIQLAGLSRSNDLPA
ncbi:hypothetical protein BS17DRAFT_763026 [Gyrodon lividus]|nr:hypothetical protein BS17DRAFT_763026 [Gyrodon lividus]